MCLSCHVFGTPASSNCIARIRDTPSRSPFGSNGFGGWCCDLSPPKHSMYYIPCTASKKRFGTHSKPCHLDAHLAVSEAASPIVSALHCQTCRQTQVVAYISLLFSTCFSNVPPSGLGSLPKPWAVGAFGAGIIGNINELTSQEFGQWHWWTTPRILTVTT